MNLNKVFLVGRLTRDPQMRSLPSGQQVASFGMATDRFFVDKQGGKQQQTEFHNVTAFGKLADISSQYLNKGSLVLIEGRLQTRSWRDASGNQKSRTEVIAERLQLGPKSSNKAPAAAPQPAPHSQEDIPIIEEEEINVKDIPF